MIRKYNPQTVYKPNEEKHRIRRAVKLEMDRSFVYSPYNGLAFKLILRFPGLVPCLKKLLAKGRKIEQKLLMNEQKLLGKEE